MNPSTTLPVGSQLRAWRQRRHLSQLDLSVDAEVSTRHLSFVETGRAMPSREMVLRLANRLEVPLRERNRLLTAAGYAPMYAERPLSDPALQAARDAVELVLKGHEPYPALAIDRHWNLVSYNRAVPALLEGVAAELLQPPLNVLRLSLHPGGLAPRIVNLGQWRAHLLRDLAVQAEATGDEELKTLYDELRAYPGPEGEPGEHEVFVPLEIDGLTFLSTRTAFTTALDVTVSELAIESFFPANEHTAQAIQDASR